MPWIKLQPPKVEPESELQSLFDDWPNRHGWVIAGLPKWLDALGQHARNDRHRVPTNWGYAFTPDVRWPGAVLELKSATKYEPIGLAEVLHHAWAFRNPRELLEGEREPQQALPILITQWNAWNRAAIAYLLDHGLRRDAIRYLEVCVLRRRRRVIAWFDEPFARWQRVARPPVPLPPRSNGKVAWYRSVGAQTWWGTAEPGSRRRLFPTGPLTSIAATSDGSFVGWVGAAGGDVGTYFEWAPR